jgi:hypothetical protein
MRKYAIKGCCKKSDILFPHYLVSTAPKTKFDAVDPRYCKNLIFLVSFILKLPLHALHVKQPDDALNYLISQNIPGPLFSLITH